MSENTQTAILAGGCFWPRDEQERERGRPTRLVSGITAANPHLVGAPYADADGQQYLRLLGVPVLVFEGSAADLSAARGRTLDRGIPLAVYTRDMFATGHDAANRCSLTRPRQLRVGHSR